MSDADSLPSPDDLHKWFVNIVRYGEHGFDPAKFMMIGLGRFMHKSHREHSIVGLGWHISPQNAFACTSFEAWLVLNLEPTLVQQFYRADKSRQRLDVADAAAFRMNVAREFRWDTADARKWIDSLVEAELITERLRIVLLRQMGMTTKGEPDEA